MVSDFLSQSLSRVFYLATFGQHLFPCVQSFVHATYSAATRADPAPCSNNYVSRAVPVLPLSMCCYIIGQRVCWQALPDEEDLTKMFLVIFAPLGRLW